ncbi:MAG: hypothetical protein J0G28_09775 [Afipia sp.]|nr:hypothetical protein [Afipia sp.]
MIWQDWMILTAQGVLLISLLPTFTNKSKWPHRLTSAGTSLALLLMAVSLWSLSLIASTVIVSLQVVIWARMALKP